jgi:repressor LexA
MSFYAAPAPTVLCSHCQKELAGRRAPLTKKQANMLTFVRSHIGAHGYAPSFVDIAKKFRLRSLATVHEHLCTLERKGYITRGYNLARAIELVDAA